VRAVIQRVKRASVAVHGELTGQIDLGFLVLLGVGPDDNDEDIDWMARKILGLRVFPDRDGKMNLDLAEVGGAILAVSQFTLYGDCRKGRRPSFTQAAPPDLAAALFDRFVQRLRDLGAPCQTGRFQAEMEVELLNHGPVTLLLDSQKTF
jgi:D-tyrosyl-tRNA(Tyr) deacylase